MQVCADQQFVYPAGSTPSTVTGGTFGAWGSWTQIVASTPEDWVLAGIVAFPANLWYGAKWQVGVGGAGAEVAIGTWYADYGSGGSSYSSETLLTLPFPLDAIPAGSRVAIRCSGSWILGDLSFKLLYLKKPLAAGTTLQATTQAPGYAPHVTVVPGYGWSWGSWVQSIASAAAGAAITAFMMSYGGATSDAWEVQVGVGSAGNESAVLTFGITATSVGGPYVYQLAVPHALATGARVSLRARRANASGSDNLAGGLHYLQGAPS